MDVNYDFCFFFNCRKVTATVPSTAVITTAVQQPPTPSTVTATSTAVMDSENPDWPVDPHEPRYCICNQVSYGDMVACDNSDVRNKIKSLSDKNYKK